MRQLVFFVLLLPATAAIASDADGNRSLLLEHAIIDVLENNPALKAAGFESRAAGARIRDAGLTPALRASIDFENFGGSGVLDGTDTLESTLSLSKVLELGGKARLRSDVARNEALVLTNEQDAKRLDILAETAKRFVQVVSDQHRVAIAEKALALTQHTHDVVDQRVRAGKSASAELRRAKITLARVELKFHHAQHALETSRLKLATMWGETRPGFASAKADLYAITRPAPFDSLVEMLDNNPDLVRFATEKRLTETRTQLARSRNKANIEITGGVRHFNFTDDTGLVVSLGIPFGNRSRAAPKIEEAELLDLRNPYDREQRRLELYSTLFEVHREINHEIDSVTAFRDRIIPLAEEALRDHEKGYAAGRYSLLELNVAQRTLLDSQLELLSAAANYHRYRIEIDRLTGAGLSTGANP
jgi:cobalt-zinc-cadmium efflux system outer membrane protein